MRFGQLIRERRVDKGWDTFRLAYEANIAHSYLNRIENGLIQPSGPTVVALCNPMGITPADIYDFLGGEGEFRLPPEPATGTVQPEEILTRADIQYYWQLLQQKSEIVFMLLSQLLDLVWESEQFLLTSTQIAKLISSESPLELNVKYPVVAARQLVSLVYEQGGVLTGLDAGLMTQALREERELSMRDIQYQTKLSISIQSRIENGQTERIRLEDVMKLDQVLAPSFLFGVFWRAFEFYNEVAAKSDKYKVNKEQKYKQMIMVVNGFRWLQQYEDGHAADWLQMLRTHSISKVPEKSLV